MRYLSIPLFKTHSPTSGTTKMLHLQAIKLAILVSLCFTSSNLIGQDSHPDQTDKKAFEKEITLPTIERESLVGVSLDVDVYRHSAPDWKNLRIIDRQDREIPFVIRQLATDEIRIDRVRNRVEKPIIRPLENNGLEIEFEIDPEKFPKPVNGITINTGLINFEHQISVETKGADGAWQEIVKDALIYDYTQYMDVKNTDVSFPKDPQRPAGGSYRLRIKGVTQEQQSQFLEIKRTIQEGNEKQREETWMVNRQPFRIDQLYFWHEVENVRSSKPKLTDYKVAITKISQDSKTKATVIDLATEREPITELNLLAADLNFSRKVSLYEVSETEAESKRLLANQTLSRFDIGSLKRNDVKLSMSDYRKLKYRIEIDNGDSPPLKDISFTASGLIYEAIFLGKPSEGYRLTYGRSFEEAPRYDTAAIEAALREKIQPLAATLGQASEITATDPRPSWRKWILNPWLATGVITLLVIALGYGLFHAAKRLESIPK